MFRSRLLLLALLLSPFASISPALAHGSHGGGEEAVEAGEFDFTPIITIEGTVDLNPTLKGIPSITPLMACLVVFLSGASAMAGRSRLRPLWVQPLCGVRLTLLWQGSRR